MKIKCAGDVSLIYFSQFSHHTWTNMIPFLGFFSLFFFFFAWKWFKVENDEPGFSLDDTWEFQKCFSVWKKNTTREKLG